MTLRLFVLPASALLTDHRPHRDGLVAFGFIRELAARGHELHVAAGRVDLRGDLPPNVKVYRLGRTDDPAKTARLRFMSRVRRLYRQLASSTFDLVHQLTPVEVGVSLALADVPVPMMLGPYVPDWPSGAGADAVQNPASLRIKRELRAAQQRRATTVLLQPARSLRQLAASRRGSSTRDGNRAARSVGPFCPDRQPTLTGAGSPMVWRCPRMIRPTSR